MAKKEKTIKYPVRAIRLSNEVWGDLKKNWAESGLSWNQYIKYINKKQKQK